MKLSVIIPTYNRAIELGRCLNSLLLQSKKRGWEAVVIDDGSTDTTADIVKEYTDRLPLRYFRFKTNRGVNVARNYGITQAKGHWCAFLDSDDEYYPQAIETILAGLASEPKADVHGFMLEKLDAEGQVEKVGFVSKNNWQTVTVSYKQVVLKANISADIHYVIKKDLADRKHRFPEYINGMESLFFFGLAQQGCRFIYHNRVVALVHTNSTDRLSQQSKLSPGMAQALVTLLSQHGQILFNDQSKYIHYWVILTKNLFHRPQISLLWPYLKICFQTLGYLIWRKN